MKKKYRRAVCKCLVWLIKPFLVDIHGDSFPFCGDMDVSARLGTLAM